MTVLVNNGVFTKSTSVGEQSVTGVGFKPSVLLLHARSSTLNTLEANYTTHFGFASSERPIDSDTTSPIQERSHTIDVIDSTLPTQVMSSFHTMSTWSGGDVTTGEFTDLAELKSFDDDGFTLNWTINDMTSWRIAYMVIGGSDIIYAKTAHFETPSSIGSQTVTGIGFVPDFGFLLATSNTADDQIVAGNGAFSFGCFNSNGEQIVTAGVSANDRTVTTAARRYESIGKCMLLFDSDGSGDVADAATFVSNNADGFTINYTNVSGLSKKVIYTVFGRCNSKIGRFSSPDSEISLPFSQSVSGVGFSPSGVMFMGVGATV